MKYRKRPIVVDAWQWLGETNEEAVEFRDSIGIDSLMMGFGRRHDDGLSLFIQTREGEMVAGPGDWIIKGVNGEFYPCKPDIFAKTYEVA